MLEIGKEPARGANLEQHSFLVNNFAPAGLQRTYAADHYPRPLAAFVSDRSVFAGSFAIKETPEEKAARLKGARGVHARRPRNKADSPGSCDAR